MAMDPLMLSDSSPLLPVVLSTRCFIYSKTPTPIAFKLGRGGRGAHPIRPSKEDLRLAGDVPDDEEALHGSTHAGIRGGVVRLAVEAINGGSLRHVDLHTGSNGWASPPGDLFALRGPHYFSRRQKTPAGDWLLEPAGVDWLRSASRLDNVLARPDNRVAAALRRAQALGLCGKAFLFAVNLQIPGRECHSAVFYFATENPIPPGSLFYRFIHGDDAFRNARFKIVNRIVKGPWIVKATLGNYAACLLGKALTCNYHHAENYLEIDVDIGSSALASAILRLALGYVTAVTIDMGFLVEAQSEEELPERLIGAVRVAQMEMGSATYVETRGKAVEVGKPGFRGGAKVNHHN